MARYDLYAAPDGRGWWLDVQAEVLDALNTRVVVPVMLLADAPKPARRLNPVVTVEGEPCVLVTQYLAAVPVAANGEAGWVADRSGRGGDGGALHPSIRAYCPSGLGPAWWAILWQHLVASRFEP